MSEYNLGSAARQAASPIQAGYNPRASSAQGAASAQSSSSTYQGDHASNTLDFGYGIFAEDVERGRSEPMSPREAIDKLERNVLEALEDTHVVEPTDHAARVRGGETSGQPIGSPEWLAAAKDTGIYFTVPHGVEGLMEMGGDSDSDGARQNRALLNAFSDQLMVINQYFARLVASGAGDEELMEIARELVTPRTMASSLTGDPSEDLWLSEDGQAVFGDFYMGLFTNPEKTMRDGVRYIDGDGRGGFAGNVGRKLGGGGVDMLKEASEAMDLDLFEDPEQYKLDVNAAILDFVQSIGKDQMSWSTAEKDYFNQYIETLREKAIDEREQTLDDLRRQHPVTPEETEGA